jgi:hypothetical protein
MPCPGFKKSRMISMWGASGPSYVIHLTCGLLLLFVILAVAGNGTHVIVVFAFGAGFVCCVFGGVS